MKKIKYEINAGKFKAQCLKIMDEVSQYHTPYTITKHGKAIVMLVPIEQKQETTFGCLKNSVEIHEDITQPIQDKWEANE